MDSALYFVTGAPGSGKSTALRAFLALETDVVAFDIDWLADTASDLAGKSIYTDPTTWRPYNHLWFEVLRAIYSNGQTPVLFTPTDPHDVAKYGLPAWCAGVRWLLLDCADELRRERLMQRPGWTTEMVVEAIDDAHVLREAVEARLDTGKRPPTEVALGIRDWLTGSKSA